MEMHTRTESVDTENENRQKCMKLFENVNMSTLIFWHNYNVCSPTQKMEYFKEAKDCVIQPKTDSRVKNSSPVPCKLLPDQNSKPQHFTACC